MFPVHISYLDNVCVILVCLCSEQYSLSVGISHGRHTSSDHRQIVILGARPLFVGMGGRHVLLQFARQKTGLSRRFIFVPYRREPGLHVGTFRVHIRLRIVEKKASIPLVGT